MVRFFLKSRNAISRILGLDRNRVFPVAIGKSVANAKRILFIAYYDPAGLSTITDNIESWTNLSRFNFDVINLFGGIYPEGLELPSDTDMRRYDGILIHSTVAYSPSNLRSLDRSMRTPLKQYRGLKILMKQDEHYRTNELVDYIAEQKIDVVITMVEKSLLDIFYPPGRRPSGTSFLFALPGYVSDKMRNQVTPKLEDRKIDVGYRGSIQPWQLGRLGYEKRQIGERFLQETKNSDLTTDISSRWEDRFFGYDWFQFLCSVKAVLGVESGSSIVDFDGSIESLCTEFSELNPGATYEQISELLKKHEKNISYRSISPRHFEAAATKTVQILYEGRYSGLLIPDRHYIPLKRDFSNLEAVMLKLKDNHYCVKMVETAFNEVVMDPANHYRSFVAEFDELIDSKFKGRTTTSLGRF